MLLDLYRKHPLAVLYAILLLPPVILAVGCLIAPDIVWDRFVFKYFWGPIEADRHPVAGASTNYNIPNTLTYGIMAILGAAITYHTLSAGMRRHGTRPGLFFFLALASFIAAGAVFRTLEDGEMFSGALAYLMISPIIYVVLWLIAIMLSIYTFKLLDMYEIRREGTCPLKGGLKIFARVPGIVYAAVPFVIMDTFYCWVYWGRPDWYTDIVHPWLPVAISALYFAALYYLQRNGGKHLSYENIMVFYSTYLMLIGLSMLLQWPNNSVWLDHYEAGHTWDGLNLIEFPITFGLAIGCTALLAGVCFLLRGKFKVLRPFYSGPNVLIMFGHFLDAAATYRAIDFYDYSEKHVLPGFLIDKLGTALVMFPIKAILVVLVIYMMDIHFKRDIEDDKEAKRSSEILFGLVKVVILMVGLAPGLRDIFRLAMGI